MRVLEVIPISKGITKETLSYFTASDVSIGSMVKVPLRKKVIAALVIQSREIEDMKSEIKSSSFALKKIEKIKSIQLLRKEFVQTAALIAEYYVGFTGAVLDSLVPNAFLQNIEKLKVHFTTEEDHREELKNKMGRVAEKFAIQSNDEDRYAHYKSIIREEFAKGSSVFFCLPTIQDIKKATETLSKGIEKYTFVLHGSMTKKRCSKQQIRYWRKSMRCLSLPPAHSFAFQNIILAPSFSTARIPARISSKDGRTLIYENSPRFSHTR